MTKSSSPALDEAASGNSSFNDLPSSPSSPSSLPFSPPMLSPVDFAKLLGISSEPNGFNHGALTRDDHPAFKRFFLQIIDLDEEEREIYWAEFASSFLPQLIKSYLKRPFDVDPRDRSNRIELHNYHQMLRPSLCAPPFVCFLQTRPAEVVALWHKTAERISLFTPEDFELDPNDIGMRVFSQLLKTWDHVQFSMALHFPKDSTISLPDPAVCDRVHALVPSFRLHESHLDEETNLELSRFIEFFSLGPAFCLEPISKAIQNRDKFLRDYATPSQAWARCDAAEEELVDPKKCKRKTAETMMCSQCRSVRYCSREHQKIAWKTHKKICFKLLW